MLPPRDRRPPTSHTPSSERDVDRARQREAAGAAGPAGRPAPDRQAQALRAHASARGLEPGTDAPFRCAVYFSDEPVNLYQIRQWYAPLQELAKTQPVVVISRMPETTSLLLDECPLPVLHGPRVTDIETFMAAHEIGLVLYVNQNVRNFQMLRFAEPAHVFVSHGESDKSYMASNQLKAYDRVFIAGTGRGRAPERCARRVRRRRASGRDRSAAGGRHLRGAAAARRRAHHDPLRPHLGGRPPEHGLRLHRDPRRGDC